MRREVHGTPSRLRSPCRGLNVLKPRETPLCKGIWVARGGWLGEAYRANRFLPLIVSATVAGTISSHEGSFCWMRANTSGVWIDSKDPS